jgi:hypothetical protein
MFASLGSAGFSLRGLGFAGTKPRRLKPAPLKPNILLPAPCRRVNLSRPANAERNRTRNKLFRRALTEPNRLALAELEALAGALLPVLLAFLHA